GVVLALARVKQDLLDDLDAAGLVDSITTERMYPTLPTAVTAYLAWYEKEHGTPHPFGPVPPNPAPPSEAS
ncbi:MAG TPA: sodium-independent anion transporter, partial [Ornithinibacter sp.]|nr:sodium-independent anion transporter [Ornithinibacter sp.]